jgi:hypothetical protein
MAYSSFQLPELTQRFGLTVDDGVWLKNPPRVEPSEMLKTWLNRNVAFAVGQATEKARSEFIIAPILAEVREHLLGQISLFSGVEFAVEEESGLTGICDFLFSKSKQNLYVEAPVLSVVEAKNESFKQGVAQVGAEMVAAEMFNQRHNRPLERVFGAVTIGDEWQFLKLERQVLYVDNKRYDLDELSEILGILIWMLTTGVSHATTPQ